LGTLLFIFGGVLALVGAIWLLVEAFRVNIWWGLGTLLTGVVGLIFAVVHWDRGGRPLITEVAGIVVAALGASMR
jgi:hypothetical protein